MECGYWDAGLCRSCTWLETPYDDQVSRKQDAAAAELGAWDVENDEAIYTYAVERMLDTGDWLTPRSIPTDAAFLEKPPLKFWLIAAPMRLGLLPRTPAGFRAVDLLLAAIAFGYVALIGYRLAGTACAIAACLLLFGMRDLVLSHGLRTNNMEASLFAADLLRMYTRFADKSGWKTELMSVTESATGGYKEAIILIKGEKVYRRLKFESGVHRVQRVPATEAQGRIHTSACTVAILPEADEVDDVPIDTKDLEITLCRSSGAGGRHGYQVARRARSDRSAARRP